MKCSLEGQVKCKGVWLMNSLGNNILFSVQILLKLNYNVPLPQITNCTELWLMADIIYVTMFAPLFISLGTHDFPKPEERDASFTWCMVRDAGTYTCENQLSSAPLLVFWLVVLLSSSKLSSRPYTIWVYNSFHIEQYIIHFTFSSEIITILFSHDSCNLSYLKPPETFCRPIWFSLTVCITAK